MKQTNNILTESLVLLTDNRVVNYADVRLLGGRQGQRDTDRDTQATDKGEGASMESSTGEQISSSIDSPSKDRRRTEFAGTRHMMVTPINRSSP